VGNTGIVRVGEDEGAGDVEAAVVGSGMWFIGRQRVVDRNVAQRTKVRFMLLGADCARKGAINRRLLLFLSARARGRAHILNCVVAQSLFDPILTLFCRLSSEDFPQF